MDNVIELDDKQIVVMEPEIEIGAVNLGIVFAGGCGVNTIEAQTNTLKPDDHPHLEFLTVNTDAAQLKMFQQSEGYKKWAVTNRLRLCQIGRILTKGMGAGGNPEIGVRAINENKKDVEEFLAKQHTLFIVAGMGGGTGTGVAPEVARMAEKRKLFSLAIVTMPFSFEGGKRTAKASKALGEIINICPTITIYNQNLTERDIDIKKAWKIINASCLEPLLYVLRERIQEVGDGMNSDLADWEALLDLGHYVQVGFYFHKKLEDECDIKVVGAELIGNQFQDTRIINKAEGGLLWFHGPWTIGEIEAVTNRVKEEIDEKKRGEVEFPPGIRIKTGDKEKWVAMIVVAKESPSGEPVKRTPTPGPEKPADPPTNNKLTESPKKVVVVKLPKDTDDPLVSVSFPVVDTENGGGMKTVQIRVPSYLAEEWHDHQNNIPRVWNSSKDDRVKYSEDGAKIRKKIQEFIEQKRPNGKESPERSGLPKFLTQE